jgi:NhaP-type Na+/H+ or K+/H+ antiporter
VYEQVLLEITGIIVLGIGAQWLAWWIRVPSILLLLTIGFIAGPVTGLLDPNQLLGDMLLPFVSLAVALILYEGGLSLRFRELRGGGIVMWRLVTMGAAVTWALSAVAAIVLLRFSPSIAILLGAILVVTGPTVIIPLLREIRPSGRIGAILKWEGIVIDPIGAMLAVLVFEAIALGTVETTHGSVGVAIPRNHSARGMSRGVTRGGRR